MHEAFLYFVDRIGSTFRWKVAIRPLVAEPIAEGRVQGENILMTEVENVIKSVEGVEECAVYGVEIPNASEGRAGMASLVVDSSFTFDNLYLQYFLLFRLICLENRSLISEEQFEGEFAHLCTALLHPHSTETRNDQ